MDGACVDDDGALDPESARLTVELAMLNVRPKCAAVRAVVAAAVGAAESLRLEQLLGGEDGTGGTSPNW